jgi:NADPH-dependent 2,4-dienoyl-CoA reductase/sulfur reductase-like enzyme
MIQEYESDVVVVGGGPAGISACLQLYSMPGLKVTLLEAEHEPGGIPRTCGPGFGLRDQHCFRTGPSYARHLADLLGKTKVQAYTETTAVSVTPGKDGEPHLVETVSPQGCSKHFCTSLILATGCFESSRESRLIPGDRPAGIITTGTLQQQVKARQLKPGSKALIVGTEHVSLSAVLTLKRAGVELAGLVEQAARPLTYPAAMLAFKTFYRFPVYYQAQIKAIVGKQRVEGVLLDIRGKERLVPCDTVVMSGRFRPDTALAETAGLEMDPASRGPLVDQDFQTSLPGVYAVGNLLRGADMHDLCALEGKAAARGLILAMGQDRQPAQAQVRVATRPPVRFSSPQFVDLSKIDLTGPAMAQTCSIQLAETLSNPVLKVWSGANLVWQKKYRLLVGRTRIVLPLVCFNLSAIDPETGLLVTVG